MMKIRTCARLGRGSMLIGVACVGVVLCSGLSGCRGGRSLRPARISHIVFFTLDDADKQADLIADCDRLLTDIPGVVSYAAGRHLDVGRESVDGDYDVGLYIGFETEADYAAYVEHPQHIELVETWGPELDSLRVHDVLDETE